MLPKGDELFEEHPPDDTRRFTAAFVAVLHTIEACDHRSF